MNLGRYLLLAQLGAGKDGTAYQAREAGSEAPIRVCLLTGARARERARRW